MSVSNFLSYPFNNTDADFRQWGLALSTALTAVGIAKTADTGQIDFTTVTRPLSAGVYQGYEIRFFSDSVGNPIFIKLEFGSYGPSGSSATPSLRVTVGNGSNGSGTITGNTYQFTTGTGTNSTAIFGFASSNGGYLTFAMFTGLANPIMVSIGRTKDDNGNDTSEGVNIVSQFAYNNGVRVQTYLPANGGGAPTTLTSFHCAAPPSGVGSQGNRLGVYPVFVSRGAADNFDLGAIVVFNQDMNNAQGNGTTLDLPFYGITHRYLYVFNNGSNMSINNNNGNTGYASLLLRYE